MKVKELNLTANITWSPSFVYPIYIACGSSAQQFEATNNGTSTIQIYNISSNLPSLDMKLVSTKNVPDKFHKILWHGKENDVGTHSQGIIVGGCSNGSVYLYSADKIIKNQEPLISSMEGKHAGPVYSLDFNQHQSNLLATGSKDCEIFIWDINSPANPMPPATKPNLMADVEELAWNRQVEHIMAATFGGRCVVYDLRKSASIIQIAESVSRIKASTVKWHPSVATQLIVTSNEDSTPVGQVWDLRFATSPLKSLCGHHRGISCTSWCLQDPDLFVTCGKDNRMLVWNPNTEKDAEIVGEFPSYNQWYHDVSWCSRDPSLIATASVDGIISGFSLLGAGRPPSQNNKFSAIADSFPGMEVPNVAPQTTQPKGIQLRNPPKWFPKRCGASFAFGGRLLSWGVGDQRVTLSQVVTEPELVSRSAQLEEALKTSDLTSYCHTKTQQSPESNDKLLWSFVSAALGPSPRSSYMNLLGFSEDQVASLVRPQDLAIAPEDLAEKISRLDPKSREESSSSLDASEQFEIIASAHSNDKTPEAEASGDDEEKECPLILSTGEDAEGLIRHALLLGDFVSAVELCLKQKADSLALIVATYAGEDLFKKTQEKILKNGSHRSLSPLLKTILDKDFCSLVTRCDLADWKQALVAVLTYAPENELCPLIETLGDRLEENGGLESIRSAILCYLCCGNLDKFVSGLVRTKSSPLDSKHPSALLELVEIVIVLEKALVKNGRTVNLKEGSPASEYLCTYASLLASQGAFANAVSYLANTTSTEVSQLRDRLYRCLGYQSSSSSASRMRNTSSSSHHSLRRTSTPFSAQSHHHTLSTQPTPPTFAPPTPTFYNPPPPQQHPPSGGFMQPLAMVPPSMGTGLTTPLPPPPAPSSGLHQQQQQPFQPPPPAAGPPPTGLSAGTSGFRRAGGPSRYVQESSLPHSGPQAPPTPNLFNPTNLPKMTPPTAHIPPLMQQPPAPTSSQHGFNMSSTPMMQPSIPQPGLMTPAGSMQQPVLGQPSAQPPIQPVHPNSSFQSENQHDGANSAMMPAAFDPNVPRGWNDPPPLSATRKEKSKFAKPEKHMPDAPPQEQPTSGFMVPEQPRPMTGFAPPKPSIGSASLPNQGLQGSMAAPSPLPKAALPQEHARIQDVFSGLCNIGLMSPINLTSKQRLQDLNNKLEVLYDKIRENKVGAGTLKGLHEMCDCIIAADYFRALQVHSATISSGTFSEMSQFMPAVKMLITTCMQCQIFYTK